MNGWIRQSAIIAPLASPSRRRAPEPARRGRDGARPALHQQQRRRGCGQGQERPHRQIDSAGDDHRRHAGREDPLLGHLTQDVGQVPGIEEHETSVSDGREDHGQDRDGREAEQARWRHRRSERRQRRRRRGCWGRRRRLAGRGWLGPWRRRRRLSKRSSVASAWSNVAVTCPSRKTTHGDTASGVPEAPTSTG